MCHVCSGGWGGGALICETGGPASELWLFPYKQDSYFLFWLNYFACAKTISESFWSVSFRSCSIFHLAQLSVERAMPVVLAAGSSDVVSLRGFTLTQYFLWNSVTATSELWFHGVSIK